MKIFSLDFNIETGEVMYGHTCPEIEVVDFLENLESDKLLSLIEEIRIDLIYMHNKEVERQQYVDSLGKV